MKLSLKKGTLQILTSNKKILVSDKINIDYSNYDIVVGNDISKKDDYSGFIVNSPGEYESGGIMVQAQPQNNNSEISLISIDIEGVNLIFIRSDSVLPSKKMLDQLGVNHILIIKNTDNSIKFRDFVDEFDPQFLIPLGFTQEELNGFSKKIGISLPTAQKNFNISSDDITEDEENQSLQILLLDE